MAEENNYPILSVRTTVGSRLQNLEVKDGQLTFVRDKHTIILDYDGKREVYNQIQELSTEGARKSLLAPITGRYYFVIETSVLWTYQDGWVQITFPPLELDTTLTQEGKAADAKAVGDALLNTENKISDINTAVAEKIGYTAQSLTEEQKNQARENIGAIGIEEINSRKQIQADWSQNNITAPDFVKNRIAYEGTVIATFDGKIDSNSITVSYSGTNFVKLSDVTLDMRYVNSVDITSVDGTTITFSKGSIYPLSESLDVLVIRNDEENKPAELHTTLLHNFDDTDIVGAGNGGLYAQYTDNYYVSRIELEPTIKKIEDKYLPDGLVIADGSANQSIIEFDGVVGDKQSIEFEEGVFAVKVSDECVNLSKLHSISVFSSEGGVDTTEVITIPSEYVSILSVGYAEELVFNNSGLPLVLSLRSSIDNITAGTWLLYSENSYVSKLVFKENVGKIPLKYFSDGGIGYEGDPVLVWSSAVNSTATEFNKPLGLVLGEEYIVRLRNYATGDSSTDEYSCICNIYNEEYGYTFYLGSLESAENGCPFSIHDIYLNDGTYHSSVINLSDYYDKYQAVFEGEIEIEKPPVFQKIASKFLPIEEEIIPSVTDHILGNTKLENLILGGAGKVLSDYDKGLVSDGRVGVSEIHTITAEGQTPGDTMYLNCHYNQISTEDIDPKTITSIKCDVGGSLITAQRIDMLIGGSLNEQYIYVNYGGEDLPILLIAHPSSEMLATGVYAMFEDFGHVVSVEYEIVTKIDKKYIPDNHITDIIDAELNKLRANNVIGFDGSYDIQFNGNPFEYEYMEFPDMGNKVFIKVSDKVLTTDDIIGAEAYIGDTSTIIDEEHVESLDGICFAQVNFGAIFSAKAGSYRDLVIPKDGTYFSYMHIDDDEFSGVAYISRLKKDVQVSTIDPKYIPIHDGTIAVADQHTDEKIDSLAQLGAFGSVEENVIEYDGVQDGKESFDHLYGKLVRICDPINPDEVIELHGIFNGYAGVCNTNSFHVTSVDENIEIIKEIVGTGVMFCWIVTGENKHNLSVGTYVIDGENYKVNKVVLNPTYHTIDPKFIPFKPHNYDEYSGYIVASTDQVLEESFLPLDELYAYRISDYAPSAEELNGALFEAEAYVNGAKETVVLQLLSASDSNAGGVLLVIGHEEMPCILISKYSKNVDFDIDGVSILSGLEGLWLVLANGERLTNIQDELKIVISVTLNKPLSAISKIRSLEVQTDSIGDKFVEVENTVINHSQALESINNIDYDALLAFDTSEIVFELNSSSDTSSVLG